MALDIHIVFKRRKTFNCWRSSVGSANEVAFYELASDIQKPTHFTEWIQHKQFPLTASSVYRLRVMPECEVMNEQTVCFEIAVGSYNHGGQRRHREDHIGRCAGKRYKNR